MSTRETVLQVEGMTCPSCVRRIDAALRRVDGVRAVEANIAQRRVKVVHEADDELPDELVEALQKAGYESRPASCCGEL